MPDLEHWRKNREKIISNNHRLLAGDEAKFKNSFKNGNGTVYIGNPDYDKSSKRVLQQISFPVIAGDGRVVGAICFSIATSDI